MANFRDAVPSKRRALLFLALLALHRPQVIRAQVLGRQRVGPTLQQLTELTSKLFKSDSGSATSVLASLPFPVLNPAALPALPGLPSFAPGDLSKFVQTSIKSVTSSAGAALNPGPLPPEFEKLLKDAGANNEDTAAAVAILALLSAIFNLVSSILYTVSGSLGTLAASLALIPASLATVTGPVSFFLSADAFATTLRSDLRANGDRLFTSWTDALTALADRLAEISSGDVAGQVAGLRAQVAQAKDLLQAAATKWTQSNSTAPTPSPTA